MQSWKHNKLYSLFLCLCLTFFNARVVCEAPISEQIKVVAAENFYGKIVEMIGQDKVSVHSILNSGNADPHLFTLNPHVIQEIQNADLVIANGAGYDPWIDGVLAGNPNKYLKFIKVSRLVPYLNQNNPHIWYHPDTFLKLATHITDILIDFAPQHRDFFINNYEEFILRWLDIVHLANLIKQESYGIQAVANEEIFNHMADFLGIKIIGQDIQHIYSNNSEPSGKKLSFFFKELDKYDVSLLFLNPQVKNSITNALLGYSQKQLCSIIETRETLPVDQKDSLDWLYNMLIAVREDIELQKYMRTLLMKANDLIVQALQDNSFFTVKNQELTQELKVYQDLHPNFQLSTLLGIYDNRLKLQDILLKEYNDLEDKKYIEKLNDQIMPIISNFILTEVRDNICSGLIVSKESISHVIHNTLWKILTAGLLFISKNLAGHLPSGGVRANVFVALRKSFRVALLLIPESNLTTKNQLLRIFFSENDYKV